MTIKDYIKKYDLKLWRKYPDAQSVMSGNWMPMMFLMRDDPNDQTLRDDKYEVFANTDHTHFVSLNITRQLFRIVHHEIIPVMSEWERISSNFLVQPV